DAILMDEPFSGLHARARGLLWEMFLRLHRLNPAPALIVTHYPEEIVPLAAVCTGWREGRAGWSRPENRSGRWGPQTMRAEDPAGRSGGRGAGKVGETRPRTHPF